MAKSKTAAVKLPGPHEWRTTGTDEINKRRQRARDEAFTIANVDPRHPIFSNFRRPDGGIVNESSNPPVIPVRRISLEIPGGME